MTEILLMFYIPVLYAVGSGFKSLPIHFCTFLYRSSQMPHVSHRMLPFGNFLFLRSSTKLRKLIISFVFFLRPPVRPFAWNKSAPTGRIFTKFHVWGCLENLSRKFVSLKADKNNGNFTWRLTCVYGNIWYVAELLLEWEMFQKNKHFAINKCTVCYIHIVYSIC
jgi:hypothetical protein